MLIFEILLAIENEEERTLVEGIYLDYYGRMLQICHQILRHPQDSEDAAMNAMKRIAENSKKFLGKDRNEIISLVVIYTRNAALTYYNQRKRRYTISTTMESPELSETSQMDIPDESQDILIKKKEVYICSKCAPPFCLSYLPEYTTKRF